MPIPFACPHCGKHTVVDDQFAGQQGPCAGCGQLVTIPVTGSSKATPAVVAARGSGVLVGVLAAVLLGGGCVVAILVALLLPAIHSSRGAARRAQSGGHLKQIGIALHNYHDMQGKLPPPVVYDAQGIPLYSWRVLILPYMEQQTLYDQFDKSKAWDAPENFALSQIAISTFKSPADANVAANGANYFVFVDPQTFLGDGKQEVSFGAVTDGLSNTIAVVEMKGIAGSWAAPIDPQLNDYNISIGSQPGQIPSVHQGGTQVLFGDAAIQFLSETTSPDTLRAMFTRAGGEAINSY